MCLLTQSRQQTSSLSFCKFNYVLLFLFSAGSCTFDEGFSQCDYQQDPYDDFDWTHINTQELPYVSPHLPQGEAQIPFPSCLSSPTSSPQSVESSLLFNAVWSAWALFQVSHFLDVISSYYCSTFIMQDYYCSAISQLYQSTSDNHIVYMLNYEQRFATFGCCFFWLLSPKKCFTELLAATFFVYRNFPRWFHLNNYTSLILMQNYPIFQKSKNNFAEQLFPLSINHSMSLQM